MSVVRLEISLNAYKPGGNSAPAEPTNAWTESFTLPSTQATLPIARLSTLIRRSAAQTAAYTSNRISAC